MTGKDGLTESEREAKNALFKYMRGGRLDDAEQKH